MYEVRRKPHFNEEKSFALLEKKMKILYAITNW